MVYMFNYSRNNGFPNSWNCSGLRCLTCSAARPAIDYRNGVGVERCAEGGRGYAFQYSQNKKEYYVYNNYLYNNYT
jgi:hypothetical protein